MRTLLALLLLASTASAQFEWKVESPFFNWTLTEGGDPSSPPQDAAVRDTDVPSFVHRINVVNRGGSAACIAPGVYVTCKHLFEGAGLRGYQVSIDGTAVEASVTFAPAHDVAIVVIGSGASAALESAPGKFSLSAPEYLSECIAFGFGSETLHRGFISNDDTLSLTSDGTIEQGDSGGAVFCDGVLVGVIRGKNPKNGRVCYFTPIESVAGLLAPFTPDAPAPLGAPGSDDNRPVLECLTAVGDWCVYCNQWKQRGDAGLPFRIKFIETTTAPRYGFPTFRVPHGADGREWFIANSGADERSVAGLVAKWRDIMGEPQ